MSAYIRQRLKTCQIVLILLLFFFIASGTPGALWAAVTGEAPPAQSDAVPQLPSRASEPQNVKIEGLGVTCPPEYLPVVQTMVASLMSETFTFYPIKALDPFVPFISPADVPQNQVTFGPDEEGDAAEGRKPLTPLQKMTLAEVEAGLKAITWGDLGRRAVIEDSTGKGYIVSVGTPVGEKNGVVTEILNDRLVIQQEYWDRKAKQKLAQDFVIKLTKKAAATR
jgi:hypothetical protein